MTTREEIESELMADFDRQFAANRPLARCPVCDRPLPDGWRHVPGRSGYCTSEQSGP